MSGVPSAAELATWAGLFALLLLGSARVAAGRITSQKERWGIFFAIAVLPLFSPSRGIASTLLTGFCVVFAARLPDLERERQRKTRSELWIWLLVPMFRAWLRPTEEREASREVAQVQALSALKHGLLCVLIGTATHAFAAGSSVPNFVRSSALVLFFVGMIVGLAAALTALLSLFGAHVEVLFDSPLHSRSLREFWGRRWNRFIARFALRHIAAHRVTIGPQGRPSAARRTLVVFFWSAVFHEYFAWGVAGNVSALGTMFAFFILQGIVMVLLPLWPSSWPVPREVGRALTFGWMVVTAPLFFESTSGPLVLLGYPESWLPDGFVGQFERTWTH